MRTTVPTARSARSLESARLTIVIVVLTLPLGASAAFDLMWPSAREAGLSGVCLSPEEPEAIVSAGELYGIREAAGVSSTLAVRVGENLIGLELSQLGGELYRERALGLSLRGTPSDDLTAGVAVRALCLGARGLDDRWSVAVDADASRRLLGRFFIVAGCRNLTGASIGGSPVAQEARAGVSLLLPELSLHARVVADGVCDVSYTLAFELPLSEWIRARAGATTSPGTFSLGLGLGRLRGPSEPSSGPRWPSVDVAWQWHPQLGVSSFVSVSYRL